MSSVTTPTASEPPPSSSVEPELDDRDLVDLEPRTPMKRLGSTRKLAAYSSIRLQLLERQRAADARAEAASAAAADLAELWRRRADLELDYARALDKLARRERHRRDNLPLAPYCVAAVEHTRALARAHHALGALYGGPLAARLQRAAELVARLHRRCRDLVLERQDEVGAALAEAAAAGKAQAAAFADRRAAAVKLRAARAAHERVAAADPPRPKKLKALDKELDKRRRRHAEARARAARARAECEMSAESARAALRRYARHDVPDVMSCVELGYEEVVARCVRGAAEAEVAGATAGAGAARTLQAAADALDAAEERRAALAVAGAGAVGTGTDVGGAAWAAAAARHDEEVAALVGAEEAGAVCGPEGAGTEGAGVREALARLEAAARALRAECRESAKTLDAAETEFLRQIEGTDAHWDVAATFERDEDAVGVVDTLDPPRKEQEDYYLAKFRAYQACAGRLTRLDTKAAAARALLGEPPAQQAEPPAPRRVSHSAHRVTPRGRFAAPLDERPERSPLPTVLTSCVRVIATYGLRHQGVFRVSGSQVEMQALRAAFERGEDPLADVRDAADLHAVCGLLKLWVREVRPPLVPVRLRDALAQVASLRDHAQFVARLQRLLLELPLSALLVLRYLFAFLAHLAEHSDRNMMDAWNLAVCLGPTLLAAGGEGGAQVAAQNLVNELVKRVIVHHAEIFPQHVAPHTLYVRPLETPPSPPPAASPPLDSDPALDADVDLEVDEDLDVDVDTDAETENDDDDSSADGERSTADEERTARPQELEETGIPGEEAAEGEVPDLVLGLPSSADTFAHNRHTLRKRPPHREESGGEVCAGSGGTARVAAQFASLTLTGGSRPRPPARPPHPAH